MSAALLGLLLLAVSVGGYVWESGALAPRLKLEASLRLGSAGPDGFSTQELTVRNVGSRPATITGIGRDGSGLRLAGVRSFGPYDNPSSFPQVLQPEQELHVRLAYEVTDCRLVERGRWPIPLFVSSRLRDVVWLGSSDEEALVGSSGPALRMEEWQVVAARGACYGQRYDARSPAVSGHGIGQ